MSNDSRTARKRRRRQAERAADAQLYEANALALADLCQRSNSEHEQAENSTSSNEDGSDDIQWYNDFEEFPNITCPSPRDASQGAFEHNDDINFPSVNCSGPTDVSPDAFGCNNETQFPDTTYPCHTGVSVESVLLQEMCEPLNNNDEEVRVGVCDSECDNYNYVNLSQDGSVIESETFSDSKSSIETDSSDTSSDGDDDESATFKKAVQHEDFQLCRGDVAPEVWRIILGEKEKVHEEDFKIKLASWSLKYRIQRNALDDLLHILRDNGHSDLSACAKTLLRTPRSTTDMVRSLGGGQFWYHGVKIGVMTCLTDLYVQSLQNDTVAIDVFVDGLSPHKSVRLHLWPIAGCLKGVKTPFVIALWCGCSKEPASVDDFFEDFVNECADLIENGFVYHGRKFKFEIQLYCADAPARAWMKKVRPHNSYNSCERCTLRGEWKFRRITYDPAHEGTLRTDESFENQTHKDHHEGVSPLLRLSTKMISQIPLDIMHLVYLGTAKRILTLLLKTKAGRFKLPDGDIKKLDQLCLLLRDFSPSDFARKPRPLSQYKLFKATEHRRLLLYDGFILHKNHKHTVVFNCYLLVACAMRILLDSNLRCEFSSDAHQLLIRFVKDSYKLLGPSFVVYNVHHLLHLVAECNIHGNPEDFSCFKYENHLGHLKDFLVAPGRTLQQIICRLIERSLMPMPTSAAPQPKQRFFHPHSYGPTLGCIGKQYDAAELVGCVIRVSRNTPKDSCMLMSSGQVVMVENIVDCGSSTYIIGREFLEKKDYFQFPIPSSLLGIYKVSSLGPIQKWNTEELSRKAVYFPLNVKENENKTFNWREGEGLCIPLLHSEA